MDANNTATGTRRIAPLAVVLAFVCSAALARAEASIRPVGRCLPDVAVDTDGEPADRAGSEAAAERAVLAAILLIPPPIDLITDIPTTQPDDTHPIVVEGPDLHIDTIPGGVNGQVLHTQSAPEPRPTKSGWWSTRPSIPPEPPPKGPI